MPTNIIINGALGRMGQLCALAVKAEPEFTVVAELGKNDNLEQQIIDNKADIVIDFTTADAAFANTRTIIEAGVRPIIGTSGFKDDEIKQLAQLCDDKNLGAIIAPNFSIGAVLMMKYAQDAAQYLSHVEIIEMHHDGKQDSPSGTALKTADMIATNRKANKLKASKETIPGARGAVSHEIPIHAIRLPGLVAHQAVIFGDVGETLTIRHDSTDRECFMPGVILACKEVMKLNRLVYGLEHIL